MIKPDFKISRTRGNGNYKRSDFVLNKSVSNKYSGKKFYLKTYGCQMNEHDSEKIRALLINLGFSEVKEYDNADLVLLNTCSIRENVHNKVFGMLGRFKHLKETKKDLLVGICGCMAQEEGVVNTILEKYKWINFVFGTHNLFNLSNIIDKAIEESRLNIEVYSKELDIMEGVPVARENSHKAFVNIVYGCNQFCTYCIVPFTRGEERSREYSDIVNEVKELVSDGCKEVTLLGQNVNNYGRDLYDDYDMASLLIDVAKTGIKRVRFTTSNPWFFSDRMIDAIKDYDNIMPSVHLPVQSGSNKVLKSMNRRNTRESYLELFDKIKSIPRVTISTDIIVGFPGESEEDFLETISLVDYCKFDNAFSFIYSKREGTIASKKEDTTLLEVKEERLQRLNKILNGYFLGNNKKLLGQKLEVLIEGVSDKKNGYYGYSDTNKLVNIIGEDELEVGDIIEVEITNAKTWSVDGKRVG